MEYLEPQVISKSSGSVKKTSIVVVEEEDEEAGVSQAFGASSQHGAVGERRRKGGCYEKWTNNAEYRSGGKYCSFIQFYAQPYGTAWHIVQ